MRLIFGRLL